MSGPAQSSAKPDATPPAPGVVEGPGLFSSQSCRCELRPADPGAGIQWFANGHLFTTTLEALSPEPAIPLFARVPGRHTCLRAPPPAPAAPAAWTVEHALSALAGLGLWDARIVLEGPEVPINDGSAGAFVSAARAAQLRPASAEPLVVRQPVRVCSPDGQAWIEARPVTPGLTPFWTYTLDFGPGAPLPPQRARWTPGDADAYAQEIAPARTFSFAREIEPLRAAGLFTAFSPRDLLVLDDGGVPIENAWRTPDEPARHKLLDLIGDLALLGRPVHAEIHAHRAGHQLNHALARALAAL